MDYKSLSISFRIQLGFHAGNNEGSGGTNVMEPRRITVGDKEYDGISGEIVRRHILENFVKLCVENNVELHNRCYGLVPDRCKEEVKNWANNNKSKKLTTTDYPILTSKILKECALCDIGGYFVALQKQQDKVEGTLKRDSCFEVGWLITEHPAIVDYTQHSAYDPDPEKHSLFVQNMRTGIYGGVLRIDLDRIGFNDWWWLAENQQNQNENKYAIEELKRVGRIQLLLQAICHWLLSPSFAKQTGWLQHMSGLLEGSIVLSKDGPAPFYSPIKFEIENDKPTISPNDKYRELLNALKNTENIDVYHFNNPSEFEKAMKEIESKIISSENQTTNQ